MARYIEKASYWTQGPLDRYGEPTWNGPTVTDVRWEEISELFIGSDGKRETSRARVYLDEQLELGDYIYRGESSASTPPNDAMIIRQYQEVRNVKGTKRERKLIL